MNGQASHETFGRYRVHDAIASGGMGTVHLGRLTGVAGFAKTVAVKRLHPHLARDPDLVAMFLDEARLAARIQHPNVVSTLDIVEGEHELLLVMEYVAGGSLHALYRMAARAGERVPPRIVATIVRDVLNGLHAAHEARDERGAVLGIVHRDVSPQNVLVGVDGVARVVDFGIAKASGRLQTTRDGQVKGKFSYMAPEQLRMLPVDRRTDVYSAAVVAWEGLAGRRLFGDEGGDAGATALKVMRGTKEPPSRYAADVPEALDLVVLRGLARRPDARFASAREMAAALEDAIVTASVHDVSAYVERILASELSVRDAAIAGIERTERGAPSATTLREDAEAVATRVDAAAVDTALSASLSRPTERNHVPAAIVATALVLVAAAAGYALSRPVTPAFSPAEGGSSSPADLLRRASSVVEPLSSAAVTAHDAASLPASATAITPDGNPSISTPSSAPPVAVGATVTRRAPSLRPPPRPAATGAATLDFNKIDRR